MTHVTLNCRTHGNVHYRIDDIYIVAGQDGERTFLTVCDGHVNPLTATRNDIDILARLGAATINEADALTVIRFASAAIHPSADLAVRETADIGALIRSVSRAYLRRIHAAVEACDPARVERLQADCDRFIDCAIAAR